MFRKKRPKRLYYPSKSHWYTKPRRRPSVKRPSRLLKGEFKKWLKKWMAKSLLGVVLAIVFVILILFLSFSSYFAVTKVDVVRKNFNVDSAAIENELSSYIGRNILFLSRGSVFKTIQDRFPEFQSIKVHKIFPNQLEIELTSYPMIANLRAYYSLPEAEEVISEDFTELNKAIEELSGINPALLEKHPLNDKEITEAIFNIEDTEEEIEETEQKSLMNRIGQAIFDQEEDLELMTIIMHGLRQPVEDREQIIPLDQVDYIIDTIQYFTNAIGLEVLTVEYLPIAREIHLKVPQNLWLWISLERDYKDQIDKLSIIYKAAELNKEDLSYIDLRVREKVIYCPRYASCDQ